MKALVSSIKAWSYYDRGDLELSRDWFHRYEEVSFDYSSYFTGMPVGGPSQVTVSFDNGLLDLKMGKIDSARSRLAEMKSLLSKPAIEDDFLYSSLHGEILLAEGKPREAISVLEKRPPRILNSLSYGPMLAAYNLPFLQDTLARAYRQKGEIDKAVAEYERLTSFYPKNDAPFLIHPKYHYFLGKLYEQKGLKAKAAERYKRFLNLWKDADPSRPEVEDARKRLASLEK